MNHRTVAPVPPMQAFVLWICQNTAASHSSDHFRKNPMNRSLVVLSTLLVVTFLALVCLTATAQTGLQSDLGRKVDAIVTGALAKSGVPSASVALVKDGQIAYIRAYGDACIDPRTPAMPEMRYNIGSVSKQFAATAILLLQEAGKLSLDDKVAKFVPDLTRADEVTIRQLLSHTSGYQDYCPQDYMIPSMLQPVIPRRILDLWAQKPLDFDPGTKWQYSNTNYVIAGIVVEKVTGTPLFRFLQERIFTPLGMKSVTDIDQQKLEEDDPRGYIRYALGPLRPGPKEGRGWLFAAGELGMSARDLARWDISIMDKTLMNPSSYQQFETEVLLKNGLSTHYGLGVSVGTEAGHRALSHSGEVSGFTAQDIILPDERAAVAVLTNQDATGVAGAIAHAIASLLVATEDPATAQKQDQARKIFDGLQHGTVDRSLFTDDANSYFSDEALKDFAGGLAPLGAPQAFVQISQALRGGMTYRAYRIQFAQKTLRAWTYEMPDGRLEQYQIAEQE